MSGQEMCRGCKFLRAHECRKNPPAAILLNGEYRAIFPTVTNESWCGEFKPIAIQKTYAFEGVTCDMRD